jgi:hypothetical protein
LKQLTPGFQGEGHLLIARAAEAEAKRRLIVTAIALERYAIQHHEDPKSLADIVPVFLPAPRDRSPELSLVPVRALLGCKSREDTT